MRRSFLFIAVAICLGVFCSAGYSKSVLWDTSHSGGFDYYQGYSDLIANLQSNGYTVDRNTGSLGNVDLGAYDAIVVSVSTSQGSSYSQAEATAIDSYVNGGGGILLMGDNSFMPNSNIQPIATKFGITLGFSDPTVNSITLVDSHPIFEGVGSLYFQGPGEIQVSSPSVELAWVEDPQWNRTLVAAAVSIGDGRAVTIGDADMMGNDPLSLGNYDNLRFSENVFKYITHHTPEPATIVVLGIGAIALSLRRRKRC